MDGSGWWGRAEFRLGAGHGLIPTAAAILSQASRFWPSMATMLDPRAQSRQSEPMTYVVDIRDWLTKSGDLPSDNLRVRRNALRVASFIEYAADLEPGECRQTLVPCRRKPARRQCLGLIWVAKQADRRISAECIVCQGVDSLVSGWQETEWAEGMMPAVPTSPDGWSGGDTGNGNETH